MSWLGRQHEVQTQTEAQRDNEAFLDSLHNKTQLDITSEVMRQWTVHGDYLYFTDYPKYRIFVYSIAQRRIERELQHEITVCDFAFVGDSFLVSVGEYFVRVWNATDGALLASKEYEYKYGYLNCITVSATSFLYIAQDTIRRVDIQTLSSRAVHLEEVNTKIFNENHIWPSEVCCGKIALVLRNEKKISIFDVTSFKVTAQIDLSPHLTEGFELRNCRRFDISFPARVVFCVGDSAHSKLKVLILDPTNLNVRKCFIVHNLIQSTLDQYSMLRDVGTLCIDSYASNIRMQYKCDHFYQLLDVSIDEEKQTSSYGFHTGKLVIPKCKSLCNGVIAIDNDGQLILGDTRNIENLYQECIHSGKRAVHFCENLSPNLFNGSLFQFYCAHRLLMMAIQDGDVQRSLHHKSVNLKWHEAIYCASKNVSLETFQNKKELTHILMEAKKCNVIESVSQYLLANDIMEELVEQDRKTLNMGRQLLVRLVHLETAHVHLETSHINLVSEHRNLVTSHNNLEKNQMDLSQAFQRYTKIQGMTGLMGVALSVIPFIGGSIAAAVTAGAAIAQGLHISDVIAGSLQVSIDLISNSSTFEQGVVRCVSNSLRRQEIKNRPELLKTLTKCGVTIDQLQSILSSGIDEKIVEEEHQRKESNQIETHSRNIGESSTVHPSVPGESSSREAYTKAERSSSASEVADPTANSNMNLSDLEQWKPSEFKNLSMDECKVSSLSIIPCSFLISAIMLQFDDALNDEFKRLQPLVFRVNRTSMITGDVLCDYKNYSEEIDGFIDELKEIDAVKNIMTKKLMKFVEKINEAPH